MPSTGNTVILAMPSSILPYILAVSLYFTVDSFKLFNGYFNLKKGINSIDGAFMST